MRTGERGTYAQDEEEAQKVNNSELRGLLQYDKLTFIIIVGLGAMTL
jgi:hypothetical protein